MTKFLRLSAAIPVAFALMGCPDGTIDTDDTDTNPDCMFATDGENPDILPDFNNPISTIDDSVFEACEEYSGPVLVAYAPSVDCGGSGWSIEMEHRGPSSGAAFYMHDSAGGSSTQSNWWGERHPMTEGKSGPNGWYERYELNLALATSFNNVTPGTNSWHKCDSNNDTSLVFGYEVFSSSDTSSVVDCIVISPTEVTDGFVDEFLTAYPDLAGCELIEGWLQ
jgi:hypothetical protein